MGLQINNKYKDKEGNIRTITEIKSDRIHYTLLSKGLGTKIRGNSDPNYFIRISGILVKTYSKEL